MKKVFLVIMFMCLFGFMAFAEGNMENPQSQGVAEQTSVMERARAAYPTPQVERFLTRKTVAKWMNRMDQPGKIFYIYIIADSGSITHYFVAEYRPTSVATYLTPTKHVSDWGEDEYVLPSNALDGTYYGEGGAAEQYFFFDAETDAYIELKGLNYIVSDQPFETNAPKINIRAE